MLPTVRRPPQPDIKQKDPKNIQQPTISSHVYVRNQCKIHIGEHNLLKSQPSISTCIDYIVYTGYVSTYVYLLRAPYKLVSLSYGLEISGIYISTICASLCTLSFERFGVACLCSKCRTKPQSSICRRLSKVCIMKCNKRRNTRLSQNEIIRESSIPDVPRGPRNYWKDGDEYQKWRPRDDGEQNSDCRNIHQPRI